MALTMARAQDRRQPKTTWVDIGGRSEPSRAAASALLSSNTVTPLAEMTMTPWLRDAWDALDKLAHLSDNWDGYKSHPPQPPALQVARSILKVASLEMPPRPELVPSPLGGVDIVWWRGDRKLELVVEADGSTGFFMLERGTTVRDGDLPPEAQLYIQEAIRWFLEKVQ